MSLKQIIPVLVLLFIVIVSYFFFTLRNKKQDVSEKKPFIEFINKNLSTKVRCVIAMNPDSPVKNSHPYIIEDGSNWRIQDIEIIKEVPLGSIFTFHSIELHKGGTSGTTTCYLFGSIVLDQEEFPFSISWGRRLSLHNNGNWLFPKSFWQKKGDEQEYKLPEL